MYGTSSGDIREVVSCKVVCLPSMNVEVSAQTTHGEFERIQAQNPHGIRRDAKNLVRAIETFDVALNHRGGVGFVITLTTGEKIEFQAISTAPVAGGSSFNIANALGEFDIRDVGIVSAIGDDAYGRHIAATLHQRGLRNLTLFRREATASSLILREPDGTATLFACKPPYRPDPEILTQLTANCQAEVLIASGVRPADLPLVTALWNAPSLRLRVFSPHISFVADAEMREQCLGLIRGTDIVHMNHDEAAHLLELRGESGEAAFHSDDSTAAEVMRTRVVPLGARIFCITRRERGSITACDEKDNPIICQSSARKVEAGNPVGAGDVHLACLAYYLRLRGRTIPIAGALQVASLITEAKIAANDPRPWAGIPSSEVRKPWVHKFY